MYGLKDIHIEKLQSVFANHRTINRVIIYGSRAMGNYRDGSDMDLTLEGHNLDLNTLQIIENDLDDLLLPYKVDLSIFSKIDNPDLIDHIKRVGKVLYER